MEILKMIGITLFVISIMLIVVLLILAITSEIWRFRCKHYTKKTTINFGKILMMIIFTFIYNNLFMVKKLIGKYGNKIIIIAVIVSLFVTLGIVQNIKDAKDFIQAGVSFIKKIKQAIVSTVPNDDSLTGNQVNDTVFVLSFYLIKVAFYTYIAFYVWIHFAYKEVIAWYKHLYRKYWGDDKHV